jgi:hypothetical protein
MSGTLSSRKELLEERVALDLPNLICVASRPSLTSPFGTLEPLQFSIHDGWTKFWLSVRVSGEYAVPDGEPSLHQLTLVMKISEKRGSERAGTSTSSKAPIPFYPVPDYYIRGRTCLLRVGRRRPDHFGQFQIGIVGPHVTGTLAGPQRRGRECQETTRNKRELREK